MMLRLSCTLSFRDNRKKKRAIWKLYCPQIAKFNYSSNEKSKSWHYYIGFYFSCPCLLHFI